MPRCWSAWSRRNQEWQHTGEAVVLAAAPLLIAAAAIASEPLATQGEKPWKVQGKLLGKPRDDGSAGKGPWTRVGPMGAGGAGGKGVPSVKRPRSSLRTTAQRRFSLTSSYAARDTGENFGREPRR